ncbi:glycosyltransferase family 4 protein [Pseudomonas sp. SK]|uniref:glycosyltransferase family 4 protein n=1 Tax=Pseudomonas sp. SK TaxID=2729423 RepID=UPI00211480F8|nr:glycosyltransferase family 4 protein [Pseudomonas sp. SK]
MQAEKKLRILVVSQYFWPESFIMNDIVRHLCEKGHEVVVATGKPNYPDGEIYPGYTSSGVKFESYLDKVKVIRVPLCARGRGGALGLILNYFSFVFFGLLLFPWLLRGREFDNIFVFSPSPITQVIPAIPLKYLKRAHLSVWIQDLWPDSLSATGFIQNRFALKAVGLMVKLIYASCDTLFVQSLAFVDAVAQYARREKIIYYPNSYDVSGVVGGAPISDDFGKILDKNFCVVFAGNLGTAQALGTLVSAAVRLREISNIRLVLVGSGSRLNWLQEQKDLHRLNNLILPGRYPGSAMPSIFARADVLLVSLNRDDIFSLTIPSKLQAYLAAGKPIIASLDGEGARILHEAEAGLSCPAEQVEPLVEAIMKMYSLSEDERELMGLRGRQYFEKNFDMSTQVDWLIKKLVDSK